MSRLMPRQKPGRSRQCYVTPPEFIRAVEARFGVLDFDLAATLKNRITPGCFTKRQDALKHLWICKTWPHLSNEGFLRSPKWRFWLNPPYGHLSPWFRKCVKEQSRLTTGSFIVLVPASVGSDWFRKYVWNKASVYFLDGRICFIPNEPYPKDLMVCIYRNVRRVLTVNIWEWQKDRIYKQENRIYKHAA
jgi:phage N-6-adenine-methyltransferase